MGNLTTYCRLWTCRCMWCRRMGQQPCVTKWKYHGRKWSWLIIRSVLYFPYSDWEKMQLWTFMGKVSVMKHGKYGRFDVEIETSAFCNKRGHRIWNLIQCNPHSVKYVHYNYTNRQIKRSVINNHLSLMLLSHVSACTRSSSGRYKQRRTST